jgi:hypothetical protein
VKERDYKFSRTYRYNRWFHNQRYGIASSLFLLSDSENRERETDRQTESRSSKVEVDGTKRGPTLCFRNSWHFALSSAFRSVQNDISVL